jgi:hypothetical protein
MGPEPPLMVESYNPRTLGYRPEDGKFKASLKQKEKKNILINTLDPRTQAGT